MTTTTTMTTYKTIDNRDNFNNHDNKIFPLFNHILLVIGLAGAAKTTVVLVIFAAN